MANARFYSSTALETQLNGGINGSATSITLAANTGFPGTLPFTLALDYGAANEELVDVTAGSNPYTVTRAVDGTSATSHNSGAVVRHVSSARDFTESRTHEAATADVHGVTGALVGATQVQTLTNKTLTAPVINNATIAAGALSGTFTGSPTFSGVPVFTGGPTFQTTAPTFLSEITLQNLLRASRATATDSQFESRVSGDSNARWFMRADGRMQWGSGASADYVNLYRIGATTLGTDNSFSVGGLIGANAGIDVTGAITDAPTNVPYKPTQTGTETVNFTAQTQVDAVVVFPVAFASTPVVTCSRQNSPANSAKVMVNATGVSNTGFTMRFNTGDGTAVTVASLVGGYTAVAP